MEFSWAASTSSLPAQCPLPVGLMTQLIQWTMPNVSWQTCPPAAA